MPFVKGHTIRSGGRPKGSKNTLPIIRDKLFRILLRRITHEKDLETVDTATLIKFASACLPKDMTLAVQRPTDITYVSNTPRPEIPETLQVVHVPQESMCKQNDILQPIDVQEVGESEP